MEKWVQGAGEEKGGAAGGESAPVELFELPIELYGIKSIWYMLQQYH